MGDEERAAAKERKRQKERARKLRERFAELDSPEKILELELAEAEKRGLAGEVAPEVVAPNTDAPPERTEGNAKPAPDTQPAGAASLAKPGPTIYGVATVQVQAWAQITGPATDVLAQLLARTSGMLDFQEERPPRKLFVGTSAEMEVGGNLADRLAETSAAAAARRWPLVPEAGREGAEPSADMALVATLTGIGLPVGVLYGPAVAERLKNGALRLRDLIADKWRRRRGQQPPPA